MSEVAKWQVPGDDNTDRVWRCSSCLALIMLPYCAGVARGFEREHLLKSSADDMRYKDIIEGWGRCLVRISGGEVEVGRPVPWHNTTTACRGVSSRSKALIERGLFQSCGSVRLGSTPRAGTSLRVTTALSTRSNAVSAIPSVTDPERYRAGALYYVKLIGYLKGKTCW